MIKNLENLSLDELFQLSRESEATTFSEESRIRKMIEDWKLGSDIFTGLIVLRSSILTEITNRHLVNLNK